MKYKVGDIVKYISIVDQVITVKIASLNLDDVSYNGDIIDPIGFKGLNCFRLSENSLFVDFKTSCKNIIIND